MGGDGTDGQGGEDGQQGMPGDGAEGGWPGEGEMVGRAGNPNGAEEAFGQSLEDFDDLMGQEREAMARTGVGTAADEALGQAGNPGASAGGTGAEGAEIPGISQQSGGSTASTGAQQSNGGPVMGRGDSASDDERPQIEGCNDTDKVARQLCEAATEEEDPFLRGALWDEYNEYKSILSRQ